MSAAPTRVLVVDDSALARQVITELLRRDPDIEVVGTAHDGASALRAIAQLAPQVVTLDFEMPGMSGLDVLDRLRATSSDVAVLIVSGFADPACERRLTALSRGAVDFIAKPGLHAKVSQMGAELAIKVKAARNARRAKVTPRSAPSENAPSRFPATWRDGLVIAIGASTGGTEALTEVLRRLPVDGPPVVIVQHMPEHFTAKFAQRLNSLVPMTVKEAADGDALLPGRALLAPGSNHHVVLHRESSGLVVRLDGGPPVMHHRPSIDVLFHSCAKVCRAKAIGVILTGMGQDGARGLLAMREAAAETIAQDEETSVVYGMPKEAAAIGAAGQVIPLQHIAHEVQRLARKP